MIKIIEVVMVGLIPLYPTVSGLLVDCLGNYLTIRKDLYYMEVVQRKNAMFGT